MSRPLHILGLGARGLRDGGLIKNAAVGAGLIFLLADPLVCEMSYVCEYLISQPYQPESFEFEVSVVATRCGARCFN